MGRDAGVVGLGLYAQAKELLAAAALEPRFVVDVTPLPACRTGGWAAWAMRAGEVRCATIVDIDVADDRAPVADVARVRAGRVRRVSTTPLA
jgi:hypothetical protein